MAATKAAPTPTKPEEDGGIEPLFAIEGFVSERPTLTVHTSPDDHEGTLVELRLMREFGIAEQQALTQDGAEYEKLWNKRQLTHKEAQRLKLLLDRMFDRVLVADPKVKALIDDQQRANVVQAFTYAPLAMAAARERREREAAEAAAPEDPDESTTES